MKFKSFFISASLIIIGCKNNTLYDSKISQLEETSIIDLVPNIQKQGMKWLLKNMDKDDKNILSTSFLIDNCNYAYEAWDNTPWGRVDDSLFLEYVLPFFPLFHPSLLYAELHCDQHNYKKRFCQSHS